MALIHVPLPLPFIHPAAARANGGSADLPSKPRQLRQGSWLQAGAAGRDRGTVRTQSSKAGKPQPGSCADTEQLGQAAPPPRAAWLGKPRWETAGVWGTPGEGQHQRQPKAGPHTLELRSRPPQQEEG